MKELVRYTNRKMKMHELGKTFSFCGWYYLLIAFVIVSPIIGSAAEYKPPVLSTTAIIEIFQEGQSQGIVLIERGKAPWGKALPGGKVEYGETVENAVRREMQEEVNLDLDDLKQFHVYSDPSRDYRHHTVEVTHVANAYQLPEAGDDAAEAFVVQIADIPWDELAFDHALILRDYIAYRNGKKDDAMIIP